MQDILKKFAEIDNAWKVATENKEWEKRFYILEEARTLYNSLLPWQQRDILYEFSVYKFQFTRLI